MQTETKTSAQSTQSIILIEVKLLENAPNKHHAIMKLNYKNNATLLRLKFPK